MIGAAIGVLAGLASLIIPGFGLVTGGGALATALGAALGTAAGGAVAGGVAGYLKDQGVPEAAADRYEQVVREGGAMLSMTVPSGDLDRSAAEEILHKYNAADIGTYAHGMPHHEGDGSVEVSSRIVEKPVEQTVNLREEQVTIERRPVDRAATVKRTEVDVD